MTKLFAVFFVSLLISLPANAQNTPPDINGWNVNFIPIDIKINDTTVAYLGFELQCQNPKDSNEFVMVVMRSIPAIFQRQELKDNRSFQQTIINNYSEKGEQDLLKSMFENHSDPVLYIKWRLVNDPRTGLWVQDGEIESWLQTTQGSWLYNTGLKVSVEFLTEYSPNRKMKNISVGRKYTIGGASQIIKLDPSDLDILMAKKRRK